MSEFLCVKNESKGVILADRARRAASFWDRTRGLLGTAVLPAGEGLWLTPCHSVHMFFMRYPIDVLFLDRQGIVLDAATLSPWTLSRWMRAADGALELPAGTLQRTQTQVGDRISLKPI